MEQKLNIKQTIIIGFAFMTISGLGFFYSSVIPLILKNKFGFNNAMTGLIVSLDAIIGFALLPLFGFFSDRTKTRFGKRLPYILAGAIVSSICFSLIPFIGLTSSSIFILFIVIIVAAIMSFRTPAVSLMPDVTLKPFRSKANAIINIMGVIGGLVAMILFMTLVKQPTDAITGEKFIDLDNTLTKLSFVFMGILILVPNIILFFKLKENKMVQRHHDLQNQLGIVEQESGKGKRLEKKKVIGLLLLLASVFLWFMAYTALEKSYTVYAQEVLKFEGFVQGLGMIVSLACGFIAFIPASVLAGKIGRKKTILIGIGIMILGFGIACMGILLNYIVFLGMALVGIGWATINANSFPMVLELSKNGNVGRYTGIYYTASMLAQAITPFLSGLLNDNITASFGGNPSAGFAAVFIYAIGFMVLALVTMFFAKYGNTYDVNNIENTYEQAEVTTENSGVPNNFETQQKNI